jgi:energy-coupling factor transporter ATP-binding protein EcfA2
MLMFFQVMAGFLNPSAGTMYMNRSCSYVFQNPDHQVIASVLLLPVGLYLE